MIKQFCRFHFSRAIWKSQHRHLAISIGIEVGIGIGIAKKKFFSCEVFVFAFRSFLWRKYLWWSPFLSTLAHLSGSFSRRLEQLFCRKPVSTCFWRKELHSRRYLRSFKNTQGIQGTPLEILSCKFSVSF